MCPIFAQGLRADNKSEAFVPYVEGALALLRMVVEGMAQADLRDETCIMN